MLSDLKNTVEQVQGAVPITVFHLRGWLDAQSEPQFVQWATEAHEKGTRYLLLDFSELDTLTSAGMRAIQKVYKQYTPEGTDKENPRLKMASAASAAAMAAWGLPESNSASASAACASWKPSRANRPWSDSGWTRATADTPKNAIW